MSKSIDLGINFVLFILNCILMILSCLKEKLHTLGNFLNIIVCIKIFDVLRDSIADHGNEAWHRRIGERERFLLWKAQRYWGKRLSKCKIHVIRGRGCYYENVNLCSGCCAGVRRWKWRAVQENIGCPLCHRGKQI